MDKDICIPGETVHARLQTFSPDFHVGRFYAGKEFIVREGARTVGLGKITKVLREDFNYWDFDLFFYRLPTKCKPYDLENIEGFKADFEYGLNNIQQIHHLEFTESLHDRNEMLTVACKLKEKRFEASPLILEICRCWRDEIQFKNSYLKADFKAIGKGFNFELTFATWHGMYLTGKIIVHQKGY